MCWDRVNEFIQLLENLGDPIKPNTTLLLVGSATADKMYDLALEMGVDPNFVVSDENAKLYKAFGASRGVINTFTWKRGLQNFYGFLDFGRQGFCRCRWPMYNAGESSFFLLHVLEHELTYVKIFHDSISRRSMATGWCCFD